MGLVRAAISPETDQENELRRLFLLELVSRIAKNSLRAGIREESLKTAKDPKWKEITVFK